MTSRKGFSLIEVLVAMSVLSLVLLSLAKVTTALALRSRDNDMLAMRTASLQLEANKFGAVPWSKLATWPTADTTVTRGSSFQYTRHIVITKTSSTRYSVKILVIPTLDPAKKDSVMIDRTQPPTSSPLCVVGCS
jgi:prepilin-type N-terminal cleavage/methylation domain-containing protein